MRVVFICGSLEPGRDGVGDYVRRLAGELLQQNHTVTAISINDSYSPKELIGYQKTSTHSVPVVRVPSHWSSKRRIDFIQDRIKEFNPEFISLQFVPFSFQSYGLPFKLGKALKRLGQGRKWHIMFHELWVGMEVNASIKFVFWGFLQKRIIVALLKKLSPSVVHTQTSLYKMHLENLGFETSLLPLFSNIPNSYPLEKARLSNSPSCTIPSRLTFVLFGGIHPGCSINDFANDAAMYSKEKSVKITLIMIGRCGVEQDYWETLWKNKGLTVLKLGEQPPAVISKVLTEADMGISTTPICLVEKSGSVAAMKEHGLPVISLARAWRPRGIKRVEVPSGILEYEQGNFKKIFEVQPIPETKTDLPHIATHLLKAFQNTY